MRLLWFLPLALTLAACGRDPAALPLAAAVPTGDTPIQGITVSGDGRVSGTPDVLRVTVGVSVTRDNVQAALDAANQAAEGLMATLREQGVAPTDIQTRDFAVQPEFQYPEGARPMITGYTVRNTLEVKLRDLPRIGEVLDAAVRAGGDAARVEGVAFALEDNVALLEQARDAAFAQARAKAEQYARLADRPLGALLSVSEVSTPLPPVVPFDEVARAESAPIPIAPGQQEVTVTVTAVWALG